MSTLRKHNAIVGMIFVLCSIFGTLLMKISAVFAEIPYVVMVLVGVALLIGAIYLTTKLSPVLAVVAYAMVSIPLGLIVRGGVGGDSIYRAGIICSVALIVLTVAFMALPKWPLGLKSAFAIGIMAYILGIILVESVVPGVFGVMSCVWSAVPYLYLVWIWHEGSTGSIEEETALYVPSRTLTWAIDQLQSVNDS